MTFQNDNLDPLVVAEKVRSTIERVTTLYISPLDSPDMLSTFGNEDGELRKMLSKVNSGGGMDTYLPGHVMGDDD